MFQIIFQLGFENKYIFSASIELHFCVVYLCCLAVWIPENQRLFLVEAEFMNVQFRWGFWAWEFSDKEIMFLWKTIQLK